MQIAISGASGFLGAFLSKRLAAAGHTIRPLMRQSAHSNVSGAIPWDPVAGVLDPKALGNVDAVIHLAGEPIAQRWSEERKHRITESRIRGTETIARAMAALGNPSMILLSASAIGIYGNRGDDLLDDRSAPGNDFLAGVATAWERSTDPARDAGVRVVQMRTGVVLGMGGGMLERIVPIFRMGLGGPVGSGRQWLSWIAREDYVRAVEFLLTASGVDGPVNVVAPHPVRNADFTRALGQALHRPAIIPVPAVALRWVFGEMADAALLASQRVMPRRLIELGFQFRCPLLSDALAFELPTSAISRPASGW